MWRDSLAILHSLTDHRRALYLDRAGEVIHAPDGFMLVCSYNPAYRSSLKELKPSFRQRFVTLPMKYLSAEREAEVIVAEAGIDLPTARRLVDCAAAIRTADDAFHFEPPSTRVLVTAAQLIATGATELDAADACILAPLSTDGAITDGLREVAVASLAATDSPMAGMMGLLRTCATTSVMVLVSLGSSPHRDACAARLNITDR